jgi:hypothetical protein
VTVKVVVILPIWSLAVDSIMLISVSIPPLWLFAVAVGR